MANKKYKYRHTEIYHGVRIDIKANTTKELAEKIQKKKRKIDRTTVSPSMTLSAFGRMYLDTYKREVVSASWYQDMLTILDKKMVASIGDKQVSRIQPIEVQAFLNSCSHLSESYVHKIFILTKQIFHQAYRNGLTVSDFSEDLQQPRGVKATPGRSLTSDEIDALRAVIKDTPDELFLRIILQCGCRPGEVVSLTWRDVDLDAGILNVSKAMKKDGFIALPKTDSGNRQIPIPDDLLHLLRDRAGDPLALVCPKQRGGYHTKSSLRKMWDRVQNGLDAQLGSNSAPLHVARPPMRMYDLRHTYCTNLEKAGVPINIASRLMGHSDISVTSKIYTHASGEALEMARDLINGHGSPVEKTV